MCRTKDEDPQLPFERIVPQRTTFHIPTAPAAGMARLLKPIKDFFVNERQLKIQQFIGLQLLGRRGSGNPAEPDASIAYDGDVQRGAHLERSRYSLTCLYSLLLFVRVTYSAWDNRFPGWRGGIAGFTILASIVLILNVSALAWTAAHLDDGYYATIAFGSYEDISNFSGRVHFGINILSTSLLAGSNYCMQCLSSPTRAEVDAAHTKGSYTDIGILSWRNVIAMRKRRIYLLSLLTLSSIIMHPIYDTSFTMTTAIQRYTSALITPGVLSGEDFVLSTHYRDLSYAQDGNTRYRYIQNLTNTNEIGLTSLWENISASECAGYKLLQTDRSTLLIVANETSEQILSNQDPRLRPYGTYTYSHLLPSFVRYPLYVEYKTHERGWARTSKWHSRILYCLVRKVPGRSRVQIHLWLLLTVTVLNAIKLVCLLSTFKEQQGTPLVTTGDAIASFLESRCLHSAGMCLLSQEELTHALEKRQDENEAEAELTYRSFKTNRVRYYRSISFSRWTVYVSSFLSMIILAAYGYKRIVKIHFQDTDTDHDFRSLWKIGVGMLDEHSMTGKSFCDVKFMRRYMNLGWYQCRIAYGGISAMVFASLPQLWVSAIYLSLNHQLSLMVQLRDWSRLASRRLGLRVSNPEPESNQVSTYWLSLPYQYSIPLLLVSASFSWLVSQTLFFIRYAIYDDINTDNVAEIGFTVGFSTITLVLSLVYALIVFWVSVIVGFRKCTTPMPLSPSNSLVIAAACHPPEGDCFAGRNKVKWGSIPYGGNPDDILHCTISSRRVEDPVEGRWYA